ncbi:hypothetical protein BKH46_08560 [Helicobacter sp. 12S02634-8]|uniref:hypothetical protein n=1 Tax=Helicobacter sp. 12S02634-8 TaxID=1476199 RepID=UPI000BA51CD3|nr:hypothetical protein [Helicobacter sp. 12S02634-8]PAF46179.1 hypothetical protein BKH46_08560 [Helicobacter sp. 12S02634-8]
MEKLEKRSRNIRKNNGVNSILKEIESKKNIQKAVKVFSKMLIVDLKFYEDLEFVISRIGWTPLVNSRQFSGLKKTISDLVVELKRMENDGIALEKEGKNGD